MKQNHKLKVDFLPGELWWGSTNCLGYKMPFSAKTELKEDFTKTAPNETMPFFVSNFGRVIFTDSLFKFEISDGAITIESGREIHLFKEGNTLKEGFIAARRKYFPIDGRVLNRDFFKTVQYNTWIECLYHPTQSHVLEYAHSIIDHGFEPGILMIDEGWHGRYGQWEFDRLAFPDPKAMVDELHAMGFRVLLWVVPCVCPDGEFFINKYRESNALPPAERLFIRRKDDPYFCALTHWWNGYSALLNLANPTDYKFLDDQLQSLMQNYGIDGFKFDGGSVNMYTGFINEPNLDIDAAALNKAWNDFAAKYDYHEFKDTFLGASHATIQRLRDCHHGWGEENGLASLIPDSIAQGLLGHPFICPDMVGGGEWSCFTEGKKIDGELFVRWAQCSALFPMMQYSKAPWSCLDSRNCELVLAAGKLHKSICEEMIEMVARAEKTGEPILRNLEYNYPNKGYAEIKDEFMLEDHILAAPVVTPNTYKRKVILPEGVWIADDGTRYEGNAEYLIDCPIERLIWFRKETV